MEISSRILFSMKSGLWKTAACWLLILTVAPPNAAASQATPAQQAGSQDCGKIKQDIEQLQEDLARVSAEMQRLSEALDQVNRDVARAQADLKVAAGYEELRGSVLDSLAHIMSVRKDLEQKLDDDAGLMQAIKEEIADLLNKLANCGPPSTTQPPKETPSLQPPPSSNPVPPVPANLSESAAPANAWFGKRTCGPGLWEDQAGHRTIARGPSQSLGRNAAPVGAA